MANSENARIKSVSVEFILSILSKNRYQGMIKDRKDRFPYSFKSYLSSYILLFSFLFLKEKKVSFLSFLSLPDIDFAQNFILPLSFLSLPDIDFTRNSVQLFSSIEIRHHRMLSILPQNLHILFNNCLTSNQKEKRIHDWILFYPVICLCGPTSNHVAIVLCHFEMHLKK